MQDSHWPKTNYQCTPHGRRGRGRLQQSWKNQVVEFMRSRNMEEDMAEDKHLWRFGIDRQLLVVKILIIQINYYFHYSEYINISVILRTFTTAMSVSYRHRMKNGCKMISSAACKVPPLPLILLPARNCISLAAFLLVKTSVLFVHLYVSISLIIYDCF